MRSSHWSRAAMPLSRLAVSWSTARRPMRTLWTACGPKPASDTTLSAGRILYMCSAERSLADWQHVASVRLTRNQYHKSRDERRLWHAAREQTHEVRERSNQMYV